MQICLVTLVLAVGAVGCGSGGSGSATPAALAPYRDGHELTRFSGFTIDGVELWRATVVGAHDLSRSSVVGVDNGKLVPGKALFLRAIDLAADELARRALALLMGKAGAAPLAPDAETSVITPAEKQLIKPPSITDGRLSFWILRGEMRPELHQVSIDLATADVSYRLAADILSPPPDPLPPIRARLQSSDPDEIGAGLQAVSEYRALAPDVVALIDHPDETVRMQALGVLGNLKVPTTVPAIVALMKSHPAWGTRSLAAQALLAIGSDDAVAAVRAYAASAAGTEATPIRDALRRHDAEHR